MKKILIILFSILVFLFIGVYFLFNLSYGKSFYQKGLMAGCINNLLLEHGFYKSKNTCECMFDFITTKYSDEKINNDLEFEKNLSNDSLTLSFCRKKNINLNVDTLNDITKRYYKIRLMNDFKNNKIEIIDAYVDRKKKDTIFNEFRYFNNGVLDSSKSKFLN